MTAGALVLGVTEVDGSPLKYPYKLKFPNTSLTDNGDGTVTVSFSAGIGALFSAGSVIFSNGTTLAEDNANFNYTDATNSLYVGGNITIKSGQKIIYDGA